MANNYDKILELANANNMGLSNTIKRDFGIPLDYTSVQASYEAALTYAATNTLAYVGQPISVGDKLYIVTAESQGKYPAEVEEGGSQIDVFLAEVGSATEGDGSTIDLKDGVLSLHGIDGKTSGTYVPTLVNGVLTWNAPDNTTVDGLTASVDALNLSVFGKAMEEGSGKEVPGLVDIVDTGYLDANGNWHNPLIDIVQMNADAISKEQSDRQEAIAQEVANRDAAIESAIDDYNHEVGGNLALIRDNLDRIEAAIPTDNSKLTNGAGYQTANDVSSAISTAIAGKADASNVYTKDEVDGLVDGLENTIAGITHFTTKVVSSTTEVNEVGILYLIPVEGVTGVDKYNEYLFIDGEAVLIGDTTTDLTDYVTNDALADELASYVTFESFNSETARFASAEYVNTELAKKVDLTTYNDYVSTHNVSREEFSSEISALTQTKANKDDIYTKTQVDEKIDLKLDSSEFYGVINDKVETAQITHTSEGVSEGVTKVGQQLNIVVDAYTKAEVYTKSETDAAITAKINSVTGGESAADVKLALEDYRDSLNAEVWGETARSWTTRTTDEDGKVTVTYTPQYGTTSRVDTLESDVATLKTNVEKAQTDATNAGTAISTLESGKVATNAANIATIQGQITGEGGLSARIGTLEAANTAHATDYANLKAKVDTAVDTTIPALTNKVAANEADLVTIKNTLNGVEGSEGLVATVAKKANAADVYTKGEVDAKVITSGEVVRGTADSVAIANNKITVTLNSYTKAEVDTAISTAIGNIDDTAITNNSDDIAVLVGNDKDENGRANKSIRAIAAAEIERLIQVADEGDDGYTIQSIQNLVDYVEANAGEIAGLVTATGNNTAKLTDITGTVGATIDAKIEAAIAEIPELEVATAAKLGGVKSATGDNKVSVAEDGVMSVATVNVNTLTQTADDILILNGGTSIN